MNNHQDMSAQAIAANIDYYTELYTKHTELAQQYNKELWYWIYKMRDLRILPNLDLK
jgi:hypothetical protein